jgi:hypothetical protein
MQTNLQLHTRWDDQSGTKFLSYCIGLHVLLKLILGLKWTGLVCAGLLANHLFNLKLIFLSNGDGLK